MNAPSEKYLKLFSELVRCSKIDSAVLLIKDNYQFDHVTYHMSRINGSLVDEPFVRSTYPAAWVGHYVLNGLVSIDPVVRMGFQAKEAFFWHDLAREPGHDKIAAEAAKFGISMSGYSVPLIDKKNRKGLLSVNGPMPPAEWKSYVESINGDIVSMAYDLHQMAVTEAFRDAKLTPDLAPREVECLGWTAKGKTYSEIAVIIGISEHTVRTYLKTARNKLDCITLAQAVSKAEKGGLL